MAKLSPTLTQALLNFDATATATALARALKSEQAVITPDNVQEFLVWPMLGTAAHGMPVVSTVTRNTRHRYEGQPQVVVEHFQILAPMVLDAMRASSTPNKQQQHSADRCFEHIWKAAAHWFAATERNQVSTKAKSTALAEVLVAILPHVDRRWGLTALNHLTTTLQSSTVGRLAFLERLTQADGLDAMAKAKVAIAPFFLVTEQKLALNMDALLGETPHPDDQEMASQHDVEYEALNQAQRTFIGRILEHPAGANLLRLDLNPAPSMERLLKAFGKTPELVADLATTLLPLYEAKGKTAFVVSINSLLADPQLQKAMENSDLEAAQAFFQNHPDFVPSKGWDEVFNQAVQGSLRRGLAAVESDRLTHEERLAHLERSAMFLTGVMDVLEDKVAPSTQSNRLGDIQKRWHDYLVRARFLQPITQQVSHMDQDQRQQALDRLKLIFANPFLDTIRQKRIAMTDNPSMLSLNAGELMVTLMDLATPTPTTSRKRRPN